MSVPETIAARRTLTREKFALLAKELEQAGAPLIVDGRACVYATGSVGRGEMSSRSDLDIFIIRDSAVSAPLTKLDEIRLKARLIEVGRKLGFPEFSDDGEYVKAYDVKADLLAKLGTRQDDYDNVFTARLLLLLESCPVLGSDVYDRAISDLIGDYWRDYPPNSDGFLPVFLMNDILRFWKTLCLNYEERTGKGRAGKRRLMNYKLKYSRLLTCYSAIVYLLAALRIDGRTVSPDVARKMVAATPTERLEHVANDVPASAPAVAKILESYDGFLRASDGDKHDLIEKFEDTDFKKARLAEARNFGQDVFNLVMELGRDTPLLRYLVV